MKISISTFFLSLLAGTSFAPLAAAQFDDIPNLRNGNGNGNGNSGNGNGDGNGNGNGNGRSKTQAPDDCLELYNHAVCRKMETIAESIDTGGLDIEEAKLLKKLMKEAKPANPNKKNFKEKAAEVLEKNKGQDKNQKELLMEVMDALDSAELKEWISKGIEAGVSELEEGVVMVPDAGELEDGVEAPPVGSRRLGVPVKGNGNGALWPNKIIKYNVVFEYDYSGFWTWLYDVVPAMNELEELTGLDFQVVAGVWTESDATNPGHLYVKTNGGGCWAHVGYYSNFATKMNIGTGCTSKGIIQHELLHVAGMKHQQSGCYRNRYIDVFLGNVPSASSHNFDQLPCNHGFEFIYDYGSLMHYGEYAFSSNGQKTIDCRGRSCGQRSGLTFYDQFEIMYLYWGAYFVNSGL